MSDHHISLHENVSCYQLNDHGKVFLDKQASAFVDFTHLEGTISNDDVSQCKLAAQFAESASYVPFFSNSLTSVSDNAFEDEKIQQKTNFPSTLKEIGNSSFKGCTQLKHVSLPDIERISDNAFYGNQLEDVEIGSSIKRIGSNAFYASSQTISSFDVDALSSKLEDVKQCWPFGIADSGVLHFKPEAEVIPPVTQPSKLSVASSTAKHELHDEGQVYTDDSKLAVIDLTHVSDNVEISDALFPDKSFVAYFSDTLTSIGNEVFIESKITDKTVFPDSLKSIGEAAFAICNQLKLEDVCLHALSVNEDAFASNNAIKSLKLDKIEHIGQYAFSLCEQLSSIELMNDVVDIGENAFYESPMLSVKFAVTEKFLKTYKNYPWGLSAHQFICPSADVNAGTLTLSVEEITKDVVNDALVKTLQDAPDITSIVLLSSCSKICLGAFKGFTSLKCVEIPDTVSWIGRDSFLPCSEDVKLHFPGRTFEQVAQLPGFPFGVAYESIAAEVAYAPQATALSIADSIHYIQFYHGGVYCNDTLCCMLDFTDNVEEVDVTAVDEKIHEAGLERNYKLNAIAYLSSSTLSVAESAFADVSGMSELRFTEQNNISSAGKDAFAGCELCSIPSFYNWDMHSIATSQAYPFGLWDDILISSYDMRDVVPFDEPVDSIYSALSSCSFALLRKRCRVVYGHSIAYDNVGNSSLSTLVCKWPIEIYARSFEKCSALTEVDLPEITTLNQYEREFGYNAFCGLDTYLGNSTKISSVNMPKCTYIGQRVFFDLPNIVSVHLPEAAEVDDGAFGCQYLRFQDKYGNVRSVKPMLTSISLPKCVRIGAESFCNRPTLCNIDMPMLRECGDRAFINAHTAGDVTYLDNCTLTSLSLPSLTAMPGYMLAGQDALVNVDFPKVTYLCAYAFYDCCLTSFDFSNIKKVQSNAFQYSRLKDISIHNVEFVKHQNDDDHTSTDFLFYDSEQLTSVTLPSDLCVIGNCMFQQCVNLAKINIDFSKVRYIGDNPFGTYYHGVVIPYAAQLTSLDMPLLTSIGQNAFSYCTNIAYAKMPNLLSVASGAFDGCTSLTSVELCNCISIDNVAFRNSGLKSFIVPSTLTSIQANAFAGCSALEDLSVADNNQVYFSDVDGVHYPAIFKRVDDEHSVMWIAASSLSSLPEGIISVDFDTLQSMASVTSFYVPKSLTGDLCNLRGMTQLQQLSVHPENPVYTDMNGCNIIAQWYDEDDGGKVEVLVGCGNSILSDEYIGRVCSYAFDSRNEVKDLSIHCTCLTCIQPNAIANCANLTSLTIDTQSKVSFMQNAVNSNMYLNKVNITNASAFTTSDKYDAFSKCGTIEELTVLGLEIVPSYFCNNKYNLKKLKTDAQSFSDRSMMFSTSLEQFDFVNPVLEVGNEAFAGCKHLVSFSDANMSQLTYAGYGAFKETGLTAVDLPKLTYAGSLAFGNTPCISADLPELTYSEGSMFAECSSLTSVSVPQLTSLRDFIYCYSLVSVYNISATEVTDGAFNYCSSLAWFSSDTVTAITGYAPFSYCRSLSVFDAPNLKVIGDGDIFRECVALSSIDLHNVTEMKAGYVFAECSNLTSLQLDNVLSIGEYVFRDSYIRDLTLSSGLMHMHYGAFNSQDTAYDYDVGEYATGWHNDVPDLTAVHIHNKSLDDIYNGISRVSDSYYSKYDIQPYWGLDKSIFKLDTKFTSALKTMPSSRKHALNDGGIAYSSKKILDLTQKAQ